MYSAPRKTHPLFKIVNSSLIDLPAPTNLSSWWNMGSLLGLCLVTQILTGLFLAIHYIPHVDIAFSSVVHITRDVGSGWLIRYIHANTASLFFLCLYIHMGRGIYYGSFINAEVWNTGILLIILVIISAFLGYVLVWGQIRFWAATVITNLLSAIPYIGRRLVEWIWGGFAVDRATLTRFYSIHYVTPFIIAALSVLHLIFLHQKGSNNPLGVPIGPNKVPFHLYYSVKDVIGFIAIISLIMYIVLFYPNIFTDPENFIPANPLVTPIHIKPEWYFLWAYAILRSIPNKLAGVVAIFSAILIFVLLPYINKQKILGFIFYPTTQLNFWTLFIVCSVLTWIGGCPVEAPYELIGQLFTRAYFILHFVVAYLSRISDTILI